MDRPNPRRTPRIHPTTIHRPTSVRPEKTDRPDPIMSAEEPRTAPTMVPARSAAGAVSGGVSWLDAAWALDGDEPGAGDPQPVGGQVPGVGTVAPCPQGELLHP